MKQKCLRRSRNKTLKEKFKGSLLMLGAIMLLSIGVTNVYNFQLLTENAIKNMESGGRLYASHFESNLTAMTKDVLELSSFAYANQVEPSTGLEYYLKKQDALQNVQERHRFQEAADVFYITQAEDGDIVMSVAARVSGNKYTLENELRSAACDTMGIWHIDWVDGQPWLFQHYSAGKYVVGVGANLKMFIQDTMAQGAVADTVYVITDAQQRVIFSTDEQTAAMNQQIQEKELLFLNGQWCYVSTIPISSYEGSLCLLQTAQTVVQGQVYSFAFVFLLGIISMVFAGLYLRRLNQNILLPISALEEGMMHVQQGDWNHRVENCSPISDFMVLTDGFNNMTSEIYSLKIQAYEAKLTQSKNQLAMLRLQLKPHFYLNAITTISSLLYTERVQDAQKFITALSKHLRYLFSDNDLQIPLREELNYCENYLKLQQIRYPDKIFYMIDCAPECNSFIVSKFMIQTMLENIFKHAFSPECYLSVFVAVTHEHQNGEDFVRIVIEDNGEGFSSQVLADFPEQGAKDHVGLKNIYETLNLMYGNGPWMKIQNTETGGASVVFCLPWKGAAVDDDFDC